MRIATRQLRWRMALFGLTVGLSAPACDENQSLNASTPGSSGAQHVSFHSDAAGNAVSTLWLVDQSALGESLPTTLQKLQQAALLYPPRQLGRGRLAVVLTGATEMMAEPTDAPVHWSCPAAPSFWRFTNYCGENGDVVPLGQFFDCALRGQAGWRTGLSTFDAIEEFLNRDLNRADAARFDLEGSTLHVVIVSQQDDHSATTVAAAFRGLFNRRANFPERIVVTNITPNQAAPRLDEFQQAFGANGTRSDYAAPAWPWLERFGQFVSGRLCLENQLAEALSMRKPKHECFVQQTSRRDVASDARNVPACDESSQVPCWHIDLAACPQIIVNRGGCLPPAGTGIRLVCEVPL